MLNNAKSIADPAQRTRLVTAATAEYFNVLNAKSSFGFAIVSKAETINGLRTAIAGVSGRSDLPNEPARAAPTDAELILDITQMSLDIVGIFDQSGLSDLANGGISLGRGDWEGAALSGLAVVPIIGGLAVAGKLGRWGDTIVAVVNKAKSDPAFRAAVEPALRRIQSGLDMAGDQIAKLGDSAKATIGTMRAKLDDLLGPAASNSGGRADDISLTEPEANLGVAGRQSILLESGKRALGDLPLNSSSLDELYQAGKLSMNEARALAKNAGWKDVDGRWIYPPNNGFEGAITKGSLKPPTEIDRYGGWIDGNGKFKDSGNFFSTAGSSYGSRALPQGTDARKLSNGHFAFTQYAVLKPFDVSSGKTTPWFDEVGGGVQHMSNIEVGILIKRGFIEKID